MDDKKGEKWNEKLYILASGQKDNPIIFGVYGEGDKPVLSGGQCFSPACGSDTAWEMFAGQIYKIRTKTDTGVITEDDKPLIFVSWVPNENNFKKMIAGSALFDYENKYLYIWTRNGDSPEKHKIVGSVEENVIQATNSRYFEIRDLEIAYAARTCTLPESVKHAVKIEV